MSDPAIDFDLNELLISRTNQRGIIQAANEGFVRVSGHPTDAVINAPHKLVRHPDMPQGMFYYIWQSLTAGHPVSYYVKNRGAQGGHYWVLATITPVRDGYLSMGFKPKNGAVAFIEGVYAQMRANEQAGALDPQQSAAAMEGIFVELGHSSYQAFIASELADSILIRDTHMGVTSNERITPLSGVSQTWKTVSDNCEAVFAAYRDFRSTPMNMQIQAGHLGDAGDALGVVATNFATIASQINSDLSDFAKSVEAVRSTICQGLVLVCVQGLLSEAQTVPNEDGTAAQEEKDILAFQRTLSEDAAHRAICDVLRQIGSFMLKSDAISRRLSALSMTRVMCAIENAQLKSVSGTSINAIIEELRIFQEKTDKHLGHIRGELNTINQSISPLARGTSVAA